MTDAERTAGERLKEIIGRGRIAAANPQSAPVVAAILLRDMWDELTDDDGVHRLLVRTGLNAMIRAAISKHVGQDGQPAAQLRFEQLEHWPERLRPTVAAIDREAVFVPSRDEFVELVPDAISTAETREAGEYLIGHGEDCVRRGRSLLMLAELRDIEEGRAA